MSRVQVKNPLSDKTRSSFTECRAMSPRAVPWHEPGASWPGGEGNGGFGSLSLSLVVAGRTHRQVMAAVGAGGAHRSS